MNAMKWSWKISEKGDEINELGRDLKCRGVGRLRRREIQYMPEVERSGKNALRGDEMNS